MTCQQILATSPPSRRWNQLKVEKKKIVICMDFFFFFPRVQFPSEMRQAPDCCARGGFPFIALLVELLPVVWWHLLGWGHLLRFWSCLLHRGAECLQPASSGKMRIHQACTLHPSEMGRAGGTEGTEQPRSYRAGQWKMAGVALLVAKAGL